MKLIVVCGVKKMLLCYLSPRSRAAQERRAERQSEKNAALSGGELRKVPVLLSLEAAMIRRRKVTSQSISSARPYRPWFLSALDPRYSFDFSHGSSLA
jgi:hypothetical protein